MARLQSASAGLIRLETMPTSTATSLRSRAPICSIQPPRNASPKRVKATAPLASVERRVPPSMVTLNMVSAERKTRARPEYTLLSTNPERRRAMSRMPAVITVI